MTRRFGPGSTVIDKPLVAAARYRAGTAAPSEGGVRPPAGPRGRWIGAVITLTA